MRHECLDSQLPKFAGEGLDLVAGLRKSLDDIASHGFDRITPFIRGDLALPRPQELAAAVNRMRGLALTTTDSAGSEAQN